MNKLCDYCGKEFHTKDKRKKFCDRICSNKSRARGKKFVECSNCGTVFERYPSQISDTPFCTKSCNIEYMDKNHSMIIKCSMCGKMMKRKKSHLKRTTNNYCSYECSNEGFSVYYAGKNHPRFLNTYTKCSQCGKNIYRKRAILKKHKTSFCSIDCEKRWKSENTRGKNNSRYNPFITEEERLKDRLIPEYHNWRMSVFERDNYTCQVCLCNKGGNLNAHHLNAYKWDVENRTNVDNGITLCERCHREYHFLYGSGNNTKEEFILYMESKNIPKTL